jgi:hypothetical protein
MEEVPKAIPKATNNPHKVSSACVACKLRELACSKLDVINLLKEIRMHTYPKTLRGNRFKPSLVKNVTICEVAAQDSVIANGILRMSRWHRTPFGCLCTLSYQSCEWTIAAWDGELATPESPNTTCWQRVSIRASTPAYHASRWRQSRPKSPWLPLESCIGIDCIVWEFQCQSRYNFEHDQWFSTQIFFHQIQSRAIHWDWGITFTTDGVACDRMFPWLDGQHLTSPANSYANNRMGLWQM